MRARMKFTVAIVLLFGVVLASCATIDRSVKGVGAPPVIASKIGFVSDEWLANFQCNFVNEPDCSLSVHVNGRRIDGTTHNANEQIFLSCMSTNPSIDYVIHSFSYADIADYSCLHDTTRDLRSQWIIPTPDIEPTGTFVHAQPVSLTCNAPPGSPVYWVLPGPTSDHQTAVITDTSNAVNASSTVSFTIQDSDHFATYNCCIALTNGQPPSCSSYTVTDSDVTGSVVTTADYTHLNLQMKVEVKSYPLADPTSVVWQQCVKPGQCGDIFPSSYDIVTYPDSYCLVSTLKIFQDSTYTSYTFAVKNADGTATYNTTFVVQLQSAAPVLTQEPTQIFYNPSDGSTSLILKFLIDANPEPVFTWFKQSTRSESLGTVPLVSDTHYTVSVAPVTSTRWEGTLLIGQYDPMTDDAIYTIRAENSLGANCIEADTTYGPAGMTLAQNLTSLSPYTFNCDFEAFPIPPQYEINIASPYQTSYTVASTVDPLTSKTSLVIDVTVDPLNTFFQISCNAYNPYQAGVTQKRFVSVNVTP